ncbi:putative flocculation suppression protein [Phaeomoniella chlamydospora]|uniref:Putative flocculation suppression protein n=1 Tax=Phaeomoniella chlamydospora TaxID=158046 RepID=A0A0G2ENV3_PHACM|nr:putative flocculation suppression protein [Phaeomoniella chlamydospora]
MPVLPSSATSSESPKTDPMDITSPTTAMGPPIINSSPEMGHGATNGGANGSDPSQGSNASPSQNLGAAAAAAAAQGPKVVQTAFIHKLYNMLEDKSIQHLISWSNTNESFVMSPSNEFSKVLAQYFKHTNISSFVRQLNMYGFHKVSDVFHGGSPDSTLWEFKHGNGNFKKGDLVGLREIKRRASRHALIHRDSFSAHKPSVSQPGTPAEAMPDTTETRLMHLEHNLYEIHARLARADESNSIMTAKVQALSENMNKCFQWNNSLAQFIRAMIPDPEHPIHREGRNDSFKADDQS